MEFSSAAAFANLTQRPSSSYPDRKDARCLENALWPEIVPSFLIDRAANPVIFTIGSCFARKIEESLEPLGFNLPTRRFSVPEAERGPWRPNRMLNEFNPGTMHQRITHALKGRSFSEDTLVPSHDLVADLLLVPGIDVTLERARERRAQVDGIYATLATARFAIFTLGLIEAWYDNELQLYLNRMPPVALMTAHPKRYSFKRMKLTECMTLLEQAVGMLVARGMKIIMTVSPVPLGATMTGGDVVSANEVSKSVLRLCADELSRAFAGVDYFPSYEIVRSGGLANYIEDNLHVRPELADRIIRTMVDAYCPASDRSLATRKE